MRPLPLPSLDLVLPGGGLQLAVLDESVEEALQLGLGAVVAAVGARRGHEPAAPRTVPSGALVGPEAPAVASAAATAFGASHAVAIIGPEVRKATASSKAGVPFKFA